MSLEIRLGKKNCFKKSIFRDEQNWTNLRIETNSLKIGVSETLEIWKGLKSLELTG